MSETLTSERCDEFERWLDHAADRLAIAQLALEADALPPARLREIRQTLEAAIAEGGGNA